MNNQGDKATGNKFAEFFVLIIFGFIIFTAMLLVWSNMDRDLPNFKASEVHTALRGVILSEDNYTLAATKRLYEISVDTRNLDPNKKELFIKLYSIYSGDSEQNVRAAIDKKNGNVILSYRIDSKQAEHLRSLAKTLFKLGVFKSYQNSQNGKVIFNGMDVVESGEMRIYPYQDTLEPLIGYTNKINMGRIIKREGIKGIERYYNDRLASIQDSYLIGSRDVSNTIILNRNIQAKERVDGQGVQISIPLKFQKAVENTLDKHKQKLEAKEVIAVVMKSDTGDILSLATSNRYDRNNVRDISLLNINAVEYTYQPGSVMKPIIYAILLREKKVEPSDIVNVYGGKYKLGQFWIKDEHAFESNWVSAENVVVYSSNIGIAQLSQRLDTLSYYKGLTDFGITQKSQIDLSYENTGYIGSLNGDVYKGNVGYGYGLHVNFMQLIKAFNVFNNDGFMVNPKIAAFIIDKFGIKHEIGYDPKISVLPEDIAKIVQKTLIKAVSVGTGVKAQVEGITVGGKTGTAEIRKDGKIVGYDSSFIGFANDDKGAKYTIGVLVIEPSKSYFGSQSAAPIFKDIALSMIDEGRLKKD
ncbi:MAG: penicillin-binding protein 2 [Campylobacteraceae bacterium]|jgi:cell division protein FtsI (penicillin-binding protein 3)|nr:penicillin-binding protein 2 [Campylobacteraceae bacterium]